MLIGLVSNLISMLRVTDAPTRPDVNDSTRPINPASGYYHYSMHVLECWSLFLFHMQRATQSLLYDTPCIRYKHYINI